MKILITGGAGFIGCNAAEYSLKKGNEVTILDNFSRKGTRENEKWLRGQFPEMKVIEADVRTGQKEMEEAAKDKDAVYHFAAQAAVTTSVQNPREDFDINALGTFNVLEAVRAAKSDPVLIYSSTNKVYGGMKDVEVVDKGKRYEYKNLPEGVPETRGLDFYSPYGCSKGSADQYVRDYSRIYGMKSVVFRQSCIYGTRQFGCEDQGWVAWLTIAAMLGKTINIAGDGKQIRDILYVGDLVDAYERATSNINKTRGKVYNIGGGKSRTLSLFELIAHLGKIFGKEIKYEFSDWRPGDQKVYVSDIRKAKEDFGWEPKTGVEEGVKILAEWVMENRDLLSKFV